jgi:acyl carrier protein
VHDLVGSTHQYPPTDHPPPPIGDATGRRAADEEHTVSQDLMAVFTEMLTEEFGVPAEDITPDATFEALGLDSLDVVELTLVLEEKTGVKLEDEELEEVRTVQDAVDKVAEKQA